MVKTVVWKAFVHSVYLGEWGRRKKIPGRVESPHLVYLIQWPQNLRRGRELSKKKDREEEGKRNREERKRNSDFGEENGKSLIKVGWLCHLLVGSACSSGIERKIISNAFTPAWESGLMWMTIGEEDVAGGTKYMYARQAQSKYSKFHLKMTFLIVCQRHSRSLKNQARANLGTI